MAKFAQITIAALQNDAELGAAFKGASFSPSRRGDGTFVSFGFDRDAPASAAAFGIILPKGGMIIPDSSPEEIGAVVRGYRDSLSARFYEICGEFLKRGYSIGENIPRDQYYISGLEYPYSCENVSILEKVLEKVAPTLAERESLFARVQVLIEQYPEETKGLRPMGVFSKGAELENSLCMSLNSTQYYWMEELNGFHWVSDGGIANLEAHVKGLYEAKVKKAAEILAIRQALAAMLESGELRVSIKVVYESAFAGHSMMNGKAKWDEWTETHFTVGDQKFVNQLDLLARELEVFAAKNRKITFLSPEGEPLAEADFHKVLSFLAMAKCEAPVRVFAGTEALMDRAVKAVFSRIEAKGTETVGNLRYRRSNSDGGQLAHVAGDTANVASRLAERVVNYRLSVRGFPCELTRGGEDLLPYSGSRFGFGRDELLRRLSVLAQGERLSISCSGMVIEAYLRTLTGLGYRAREALATLEKLLPEESFKTFSGSKGTVRVVEEPKAEPQEVIPPAALSCKRERGQGRTHREYWVIGVDGSFREGKSIYDGHHIVATEWATLNDDELVLCWERAPGADATFDVLQRPAQVTEAQKAKATELEAEYHGSWELTEALDSVEVPPVPGEIASADALAALKAHFAKK